MSTIIPARMTAQLDGDFIVFLIGMRVNKWWKFWKWLPVASAMPRVLIELAKQPELGLLHARSVFGFPNVLRFSTGEALTSFTPMPPTGRWPICRPGAISIAGRVERRRRHLA